MTKGLKLTTVAIAALFVFAFGAVVLPSAYADETTDFNVTGTVTDDATLSCSDGSIPALLGIADGFEQTSGALDVECTQTNSSVAGWELSIISQGDATDQLRLAGTGTYAGHAAFTQYPSLTPTDDWTPATTEAYIGFRVDTGTDHPVQAFLTDGAGTCNEPAGVLEADHCYAAIPASTGTAIVVSADSGPATTTDTTMLEFAYEKEDWYLQPSAVDEYTMTIDVLLELLP